MSKLLLMKSEHVRSVQDVLKKFSHMAKNSRTQDNEGAVDGWGASWLDEDHEWQEHRSIRPVWEDEHWFEQIPSTRILLLHARAEHEPLRKRRLMFNEPFTHDNVSFVVDTALASLEFPYPIPGEIDSQRIWHLLQSELAGAKPEDALRKCFDLLRQHATHLQHLQLGLSNGKHLYAFSYATHMHHLHLHVHTSPGIQLVCSESLPGYDFYAMTNEQLIIL